MRQITLDELRLLMSGIGDKYYTASKNIESWVTLRIPLECKPTLDNALKLAYNLVRCKDCKWRTGAAFWTPCQHMPTTDDWYCGFGERDGKYED